MRGSGAFEARALAVGAAWLLSSAAGCVELQPRVERDAGNDTSADIASLDASEDRADAGQAHDALDVTTAADARADLPAPDMPDVGVDDRPDVILEDRPDAVVSGDLAPLDALDAGAPDVVMEDHVDAPAADVVDAPAADVVDAPAVDVVDASVNPFPSTGADGPFPPPDAGTVITLEPRVWNFTTITVPFGTTVRVALGSGILDLRATGEVLIAGTIDLGGGPGGSPIDASNSRGPGYGGDTATALIRPQGNEVRRPPSDAGGRGGQGSPGENVSCATLTPPLVALGGAFGGGSGGGTDYCFGGAGGGGFAGGAGGGPRGGRGASDRVDLGGNPHASMAAEGGQPNLRGGPLAAYAGGAAQMTPCTNSGGGGSIGESAARDLQVRSTFRPGSGGGGGSGSAGASNPYAGGGGGGGGGALRIASATSIVVSAQGVIRVDGGAGGVGSPGLSSVGAGGGGSGGVIYLASPALVVRGTLSARGGIGALSCARGGNGGIGRIRLSVDPAQCDVAGTVNPPITTGCAPSPDGGVPAQAFVGRWPD